MLSGTAEVPVHASEALLIDLQLIAQVDRMF